MNVENELARLEKLLRVNTVVDDNSLEIPEFVKDAIIAHRRLQMTVSGGKRHFNSDHWGEVYNEVNETSFDGEGLTVTRLEDSSYKSDSEYKGACRFSLDTYFSTFQSEKLDGAEKTYSDMKIRAEGDFDYEGTGNIIVCSEYLPSFTIPNHAIIVVKAVEQYDKGVFKGIEAEISLRDFPRGIRGIRGEGRVRPLLKVQLSDLEELREFLKKEKINSLVEAQMVILDNIVEKGRGK